MAVLVNRGARDQVEARGIEFRAAYELSDLGIADRCRPGPAAARPAPAPAGPGAAAADVPAAGPPCAASRRNWRSRYTTKPTMATTTSANRTYPTTVRPWLTLFQALPSP